MSFLTRFEPARVRAVVAAVIALAGALGVTLGFDLPGIAEALLLVLAAVVPLVQGEATRAVVVPVDAIPAGTVLLDEPGRHAAPGA